MKFFKKRPKARIKIGNTFLGDKLSATAQGYVIYKEWDNQDKKNYYWEEWELTGFNDYDSWIEYDHYTRKVTLYEPIDIDANLDPDTISVGQSIATIIDGAHTLLHVFEIGTGTVERREGTLTYHVFEGEPMTYAEIRYDSGVISVEKYNNKEYDVYKGRVLTPSQQKKMFGRTLKPRWWRENFLSIIIFSVIGSFFIVPYVIPQYETYCTPRTATASPSSSVASSTDQVVSQSPTQTCYRRAVYGGGAGGSGVGK